MSVSLSGAIGGGANWVCTLWFGTNSADESNAALAAGALAATRTHLDGWDNAWAAFNTSDTTLTGITVRVYDGGSDAAAAVAEGAPATAIAGTNGAQAAASQCVVTSLRTDNSTRSGRGRLYWPATGGLDGDDHNFLPARCASFADATVALYEGIMADADPGSDFTIGAVRSLKLGQMIPITRVVVDERPDRQEHRERHLSFGVHSAAFV